jgi:hypothetical protein
MPTTLVAVDKFKGGAGLTGKPVGADPRSLAGVLREIQTIVNATEISAGALTSPWQYMGDINAAGDFPLLAAVQTGWFYTVSTGCTDNTATRTATGQVFLAGDKIVWDHVTNLWVVVERGASTATPNAVGTAAAGVSAIKSNQDHIHAHGNQLGGTLHADVVAGVSAGFMTAAMATTLAAITDDHIRATVTGLDMKTDEHEHTAVLNGDVAKLFYATHALVKSSVNVGALNNNGTINIGTAADGAQIAAGLVLTGVGAVGTGRMIPISAHAAVTAGNATLYINVESAETGAGTLEIDVAVCGRQF